MNFIRNIFGSKKPETRVFDISLKKMQAAFAKMETEAGWNTKKKLAWGYYFFDHDLTKLQEFGKRLKKSKLQIIETRKVEESPLYLLHIAEQVVHTPDSLFEQCHILAEMAHAEHIETFDGWDVEPVYNP